jgi:hypothetical protein
VQSIEWRCGEEILTTYVAPSSATPPLTGLPTHLCWASAEELSALCRRLRFTNTVAFTANNSTEGAARFCSVLGCFQIITSISMGSSPIRMKHSQKSQANSCGISDRKKVGNISHIE